MLLIGVFLAYAVRKGQKLIYKQDPTVIEVRNPNVFNQNDTIDLNDIGFKMAFTVIDWANFEPRNDSNFVRWRVSLRTFTNFVISEEIDLSFHLCTD
jgi:hypothetical protein